jgi:MFS family permease
MDEKTEKKRMASGRNMSVLEGFIQTIGINMGGVYLPNFILTAFLLEIMHASHALIGLATSVQFFVGLLQPLANIFVHNVKRRNVVTAIAGGVSRFLFVGAIFYGMASSGPGAEAVFMVILLVGAFSMSISSSTWSTWMADLVPDQIRGRYFALRNSVASVAGIFAVLVGGWLLKTFPGPDGYVVVYCIAAVTALVGTVLLYYQYSPPVADQPHGSMLASYKEIFKDRNFMAFVRMVLFFNLALVVAGPFFTVHFLEVLHVPIDLLAYFTAAAAVTGILGNLFFGKMSDILGNRFIIRFSLLLLTIPTALMLFLPEKNPLPFVAAIILMQSFFGAGWNLATFNTSLSISPRGQRSLYIGVYNSLNSVSAVFAPILGGFLIDLYKTNHVPVLGLLFPPTTVVFALSVILLLAGLLAFPFYREANRNEDYSLRDVVFRMNFPEILYKLFVSTFMPRISSRHRLTEDIADLRSPAAVVPLGRLLDDMDPEVRMSALEGLGKTGADEAVEALLPYHDRAGVLEKIEILKAFKAFAGDPRVKVILLEVAAGPYLARRLRALRSLVPVAADAEVAAFALGKLQAAPLPPPTDGSFEEEEYLAWVELSVAAREWDTLEVTLPFYPLLSQPTGRRGLLFHWSTLLGFRDEFYRYLSYEQPDDKTAVLDEARAASMETLAKNKVVAEIRFTLKQEAKTFGSNASGFFQANEKALFRALKPWNASVQSLVKYFLHHPLRTEEEEVFFLLAVKTLTD